ncbi:MAG: hypothetical protein E7240_03155 [Lachnospiraceae bacterium]|nr:hypothetical protein [Lachnospiraceae bacterium]
MEEKKNKPAKMTTFSVPLGLLDYINPICYSVTVYTLAKNMKTAMGSPWYTVFMIGAILSLVFGFVIPTGKLIVGLGIIKFVMPVILVFLVNTGILIAGTTLFKTVMGLSDIVFGVIIAVVLVLLAMIYRKSKKFNTVAVLIGAAGYVLIYTSLITMSIRSGRPLVIFLFALAICLFVFLCTVGIKANLYDPKVHWVIEGCNVVCQFAVALGTVLLFR